MSDTHIMMSLHVFQTMNHKNCVFFHFLGRHFGCRPLDPTLDIWSNFVKKKKRKKKSILPPYNLKITNVALVAMPQGFPRVPKGY